MQRELSPRVWKQWMEHLARNVHPDIPAYIALSMQGYDDIEIVGDPTKPNMPGMLPTFKPETVGRAKSFIKYKIPKILSVSKAFFQSIGEESFAPV
jgi:hypothetical protein